MSGHDRRAGSDGGRDATHRFPGYPTGPSVAWNRMTISQQGQPPQSLPRHPTHRYEPLQYDLGNSGSSFEQPISRKKASYSGHTSQTFGLSSSSRPQRDAEGFSPRDSYLQPTSHAIPSPSSSLPPTLSNPFARSSSGPQPQFKALSQGFPAQARASSGSGKSGTVSRLISMFDGKPIDQNLNHISQQERHGLPGHRNQPYSSTLAAAMGQNEVWPPQNPPSSQHPHISAPKKELNSAHILTSSAGTVNPGGGNPSVSLSQVDIPEFQRGVAQSGGPSSSQSYARTRPENPSAPYVSSQNIRDESNLQSGLLSAIEMQNRPFPRASPARSAVVIKSEDITTEAGPSLSTPVKAARDQPFVSSDDGGIQSLQTPQSHTTSARSGPASVGLTTPTDFGGNSEMFISPSSIRSGPESPDPLNVISPVKKSNRNRQGSPTPLRSASHLSGLAAAMGSSMRPTLTGHGKRRIEESAAVDGSNAQQKKIKNTNNLSSPVKAIKFYSNNNNSGDESSDFSRQVTPTRATSSTSGSTEAAKAPVHQAGKPRSKARVRKKNVSQKPDVALEYQSKVTTTLSNSDEVAFKGVKGRRAGTTFTSRLRLALPSNDDTDSGSAEEWDKEDDVVMYPVRGMKEIGPSAGEPQTPITNAPVSSSSRTQPSVIKVADRRSPMKKLLNYMEDLFEAESSLPDQEALASTSASGELPSLASEFFVVVDGNAILKPARIQHLSKLVRKCAASQARSRPLHVPSVNVADDTLPTEPESLDKIELQEMQKVLRILHSAMKVADGSDPFKTAAVEDRTRGKAGSKSPSKKRAIVGERPSPLTSPTKSSGTKDSCEEEIGEGEGSELEEADEDGRGSDALGPTISPKGKDSTKVSKKARSPSKSTAGAAVEQNDVTEEQRRQLGEQLSRIATSLMSAECCLTIVSQENMDKSLASEDLLRSCFDILRSALEQVVFPYIEACANINTATPHPLLGAWIDIMAPQTAKQAKKKPGRPKMSSAPTPADETDLDPSGIFAGCADYLASIFRSGASSIAQAQKLIQLPTISLSESILLSAIYTGLGPFFAIEPDVISGSSEAAKANARGRKAMEVLAPGSGGTGMIVQALRLPALTMLCDIFSRHPDQRQWIVEEILTSLIKLPDMKKNRRQYTLRNGKSISSITALLLQLTQAASYGLRDYLMPPKPSDVSATTAALEIGIAATRRAGDGSGDREDTPPPVTAPSVDYDLPSLRKALEGPSQTSRAIATFLMSRVSAVKVTKSSGDFSYASVLDNLVGDLLTTVFLPEWPASILLLSSLCRAFSSILEDPKALPDSKGVALEHLGTLAAHLRASQLKVDSLKPQSQSESQCARYAPRPISFIESTRNAKGLGDLNFAYTAILSHLAGAEVNDRTSKTARDFLMAQWGSELSGSLVRTSAALDIAREAQDETAREDVPQISAYLARLHQSLLLLSSHCESRGAAAGGSTVGNVFDIRSMDSYEAVTLISEQLTQTTSYAVTFDFARSLLVEALDSQAVGNRTKAIRGLSGIYAVDASLIDNPSVRDAIETRLSDESIGVREAAVGLLSKYLLGQPEDMQTMYEKLRERIFDAGLAVRKRTLRLLASIYRTLPSDEMRIDACTRMVRCVNDEDVGIQDLAVQTLGEIWLRFSPTEGDQVAKKSQTDPSADNGPSAPSEAHGDDGEADCRGVDSDMAVIVQVAGAIRERPSPLEEVFRRFGKNRSEAELEKLIAKLKALSDRLITALDEDDETSGGSSSLLIKIKAIYLLVSTNPSVLSIANAKALLPYLRGSPQTAEEAAVLETLLKIFRVSLPTMPRTALAFAHQLEAALRPLLNNPPRHMTALQEVIACYSIVVRSHTENYSVLIRTFGVLLKALGAIADKLSAQPDSPVDRKARMIMSETSLLCENANLDGLRKERPELRQEIDAAVGTETSRDIVFRLLLSIRKSPTYRPHALQDIGFLFRGYPLLMIEESGMEVMDDAFKSQQVTEQEMLLRIILDFLTTDSAKRAPETATSDARSLGSGRKTNTRSVSSTANKVDMSELVGNTDNFADSGVSSILVQRYLDPILNAAASVDKPGIQRPAMDILKSIVLQGLCHPLQCMPTLISLETTSDWRISNRALQLHEHLASKHGSILAARYGEMIKSSFEFQLSHHQSPASQQDLRGYRIDAVSGLSHALLQPWYSLLKERRQTRLDFLKAMSKLLDFDTSSNVFTNEKVLLSRYIADNLAVLEYKTLEEVLLVIADLKKILAVSGAQVKYMAEEYVANAEQEGDMEAMDVESQANDVEDVVTADEDELADLLGETQVDRQHARLADRQAKGDAHAKPSPFAVARMSIVMGTALLLRHHLKTAYGLSEDRCSKFDPKKRQTSGADRPAVRKGSCNAEPLSFHGLPLALDAISSRRLALQQMATFEDLMDEEGTMAEMDEDWEE